MDSDFDRSIRYRPGHDAVFQRSPEKFGKNRYDMELQCAFSSLKPWGRSTTIRLPATSTSLHSAGVKGTSQSLSISISDCGPLSSHPVTRPRPFPETASINSQPITSETNT